MMELVACGLRGRLSAGQQLVRLSAADKTSRWASSGNSSSSSSTPGRPQKENIGQELSNTSPHCLEQATIYHVPDYNKMHVASPLKASELHEVLSFCQHKKDCLQLDFQLLVENGAGKVTALELACWVESNIRLLQPDIAYIQQVPKHFYDSHLHLLMRTLHYEGVFQATTSHRGQATFYRTSLFASPLNGSG